MECIQCTGTLEENALVTDVLNHTYFLETQRKLRLYIKWLWQIVLRLHD